MPGIQVLFNRPSDERSNLLPQTSPLATERADIIYHDDVLTIRIFTHDTYPYKCVDHENYVLLIEGMVNNRDESETIKLLTKICLSFSDGVDVNNRIDDFVKNSDGDFIVVIYDKSKQSLLCFNDQYSRLPFFYYHDDTTFLASRRISYMLPAVPDITLSKQSIAEYIAFEYYLGYKTAYKNIKRLPPGTHLNVRLNKEYPEQVSMSICSKSEPVFDEINPVRSRDECVDTYTQLFLSALSSRYQKTIEKGSTATVDLSGGYDSRAIMMGLEHLGYDAKYYTHNVITGDESNIAGRLADSYDRKLSIVNASHEFSEHDLEQLVYATDLTMNGWTAVSCWQDYIERKRISPDQSVVFTGLGGEYSRHPYKPVAGITSLPRMTRMNLLPSQLPLSISVSLMNISEERFFSAITSHFESYPDKTMQGKFKRFYFEYHKVVNAGEDRTRSISWTQTPFDSIPLLRYTFESIPLEYLGFSFFISFLREMGNAALNVPIHGSKVPLLMPMSGAFLDIQSLCRSSVRSIIKKNDTLFRMYQHFVRYDTTTEMYQNAVSLIREYMNHSKVCMDLFNHENVHAIINSGMGIPGLYRLLSVMMYVKRLEDLYGNKLEIDE